MRCSGVTSGESVAPHLTARELGPRLGQEVVSGEHIRSTGAIDTQGRGHKGSQVDELVGGATDVD